MSSIMCQFDPEHQDLLALEFGKIPESDFVYTLASTIMNQSAPNLVKMYVTIRSRMSSITSKLPIFSVKTPEKLCQMASTQSSSPTWVAQW